MPDPVQVWPGLRYAWLPFMFMPPARPEVNCARVCLGNRCWAIQQLRLADAREMVEILSRRSWPLQTSSLMAAVLYAKGFEREARIIQDAYGGIYGVEAVQRQIDAVYDSWV